MYEIRSYVPEMFDEATEFMYQLVENVDHLSKVGQGVGGNVGKRWQSYMGNVQRVSSVPNLWFDGKGDPSSLLKALKTDWRRFKEASFKQVRDNLEWMGPMVSRATARKSTS